jgi:hypothetical protein
VEALLAGLTQEETAPRIVWKIEGGARIEWGRDTTADYPPLPMRNGHRAANGKQEGAGTEKPW